MSRVRDLILDNQDGLEQGVLLYGELAGSTTSQFTGYRPRCVDWQAQRPIPGEEKYLTEL